MLNKANVARISRRMGALAGVSIIGLTASWTAHAQTANNAPEEIIVTAQRRAERLQDVPLSIASLSAGSLERSGVTSFQDLTDLVPGLHMVGAGSNISPTIRGVNSQQTDPGNDANTATYVDGVYQPSQNANFMDLPDIDRIEVLKGPQGTLFGRNATGGAIRVFTKGPSLDRATGSVDLSYGNFNKFAAKGFVSVPLVEDRVAASISGFIQESDGYYRDIVRNTKTVGDDARSVRAKILAKPSDNLSIEVFGAYAKHVSDVNAFQPLDGSTAARGIPGVIIPSRPYEYAGNIPAVKKDQQYTAGLKATLDTDIGEFSSVTSYVSSRSYMVTDADGSSANLLIFPINFKNSATAQELTFASKKFGQFLFTAGANYYDSTGRYDPLILQGDFFAFAGPQGLYGYQAQETTAYAGFAELTFTPTDRLTFIAGARYSSEDRDAEGGYFGAGPRPAVLPPLGKVTYNRFTPRASVRYQLTDAGDNAYFTFSQGFKSGGFNISGAQTAPFRPEKVNAYEIGLKTSPSRMISANAAAFYYDYTDQQVFQLVNTTNITTNAASTRIYGAEADITARLTDEFTVNVGLAWLDAKYRNYTNVVINPPAGGPGCLCGNVAVNGVDLSGTTPPYAPKFSFTVDAAYTKELPIGTVGLSATVYYTSSFFQSPVTQQGRYATLAMRGSFQPTDSNFTFYAYGRNITNTLYILALQNQPVATTLSYAAPATYGAGVKYAF